MAGRHSSQGGRKAAAALAVLVAAAGTCFPAAAGPLHLAAQIPPVSRPAPVPPGGPAPPVSERSLEVLRLDCATRLGRREVTLFGNGTIRLRDGPLGREWMGLAELGPDELQGTLRRLAAEDLSDAVDMMHGVSGEWVERCDLIRELPGARRFEARFGRYDTLPLGLSHVRQIAEQLGAKVALLRNAEVLPERYVPRLGDVVKRVDGNLFRVVNFTSDHKGVELDGVEQPVHLIVLNEQMRLEFVAVVSRER
jgi:hypothetical protein